MFFRDFACQNETTAGVRHLVKVETRRGEFGRKRKIGAQGSSILGPVLHLIAQSPPTAGSCRYDEVLFHCFGRSPSPGRYWLHSRYHLAIAFSARL